MALKPGKNRIGPPSGRLYLKTSRTGLGRRAGHDLTIEVTRWSGEVTIADQDLTQSSLSVSADARSLEVREGTGGVKPLTDSDRRDIKKNLEEKSQLNAGQFPQIAFRSTAVQGDRTAFQVHGELTLRGSTRPLTLEGRSSPDGRITGHAILMQSQWGVKPYTAFLGALRLADEVNVAFEISDSL